MAEDDMSLNDVVNKTIFGKANDLSKQDPKQGVSQHHIFTKDMGHVPGVAIKHWDYELQKRRKEILDSVEGNFMKRVFSMLGSKDTSHVFGKDLVTILNSGVTLTPVR